MVEERRYVLASANLERMFGYEPGELQGKSTRIIFNSDEQFERIGAAVYSAWRKARRIPRMRNWCARTTRSSGAGSPSRR
jgi:hypothetical protein